MGRVAISTVEEADTTSFPALTGVSSTGQVTTKAVVAKSDRPIMLWQHTMAPGSTITWNKPPVGSAAYVWEGEAEADGKPLHQGGALIVAHGGQATLKAGSGPVTLMHFHRPENHSERPTKAGGCTHVINRADTAVFVGTGADGHIYVDSGCPTCDLWFHENTGDSAMKAPPHYHTEDEIIFIISGSMAIGKRRLMPGTAIAVDADTVYQFKAGEEGLGIVNYRPCEPNFAAFENGQKQPPVSERAMVLDAIAKTKAGQPLWDVQH